MKKTRRQKPKQINPADCIFRYHNGQRMKALDGWRALLKMEAAFTAEVRLELEQMQAEKSPQGVLLAAKLMREVLDEPDYDEDEQGMPSGMTDMQIYRVYLDFIQWTEEFRQSFSQPQT